MEIKWYGHAAFRIITQGGTRIILDPYESGFRDGLLSYEKIDEEADIVVTSHSHGDHSYTSDIRGTYDRVWEEGAFAIRGMTIRTIPTFHDDVSGARGGGNLITVISADGLTVAHLGDLGHLLPPETRKRIGQVDILLLPVGGFYTIGAEAATTVMNDIHPSVTIPMHYKTAKCAFPITGVEEFTRGKKNVHVLKESMLKITAETLPREPEIVVLEPAR
jgi:L-ascorbate metabolism protein UlaG (beta-lactamase superfamily)